MKKLVRQLYESSVIRYLFFGGCTTLVNMVSFYILRKMQVELNTANMISIVLAILFACVVNSKYVFQSKYENLKEIGESFLKFISARAATMVIEIVGLWLLVEQIKIQEMLGKLAIQFIVVILNYVFSKLFVFKKK